MHSSELLTIQIAVLCLLLIACWAQVALKRWRFPYTVGLLIFGFALGLLAEHLPILAPIKRLQLSHELILFIFVPPLVFGAALDTDSRLLMRNLAPVFVLAGPGLLISTLIIGGLLGWLTPLTFLQAVLLAR